MKMTSPSLTREAAVRAMLQRYNEINEKLATELSRASTGRTLYLLDEPTTGLHFHDVAKLLEVLFKLRASGNTLIVIEHNLDVIKTADWIIDLGPEGGAGGGRVVAIGTPEEIAALEGNHTGQFLKSV